MDYDKLVGKINYAAEVSIPAYSHTEKANIQLKGKPWWNKECDEVVLLRKQWLRAYKVNPNLNNFLEYKKQDAITRITSADRPNFYITEKRYLLQPLTMHELNMVLKQHNNTSPGMDNIHYSMLSNLPENGKGAMLHIKPIPIGWNNYAVIPILKPGKVQDKAQSYRPIALALCVLKT